MLSALHPCSFSKLQLSEFVPLRDPSATSCAENVTPLCPLCPLALLADIAWKKLLWTQKMSCSACENVSGNNTGPLSSSLRLNFMSFKWDLRIAMTFECFPHNGGKGPIPSGDWHKKYPIPHTLRKPNLNCWVSYSIVRLSCGGEHGACPQIHSALFETTFMQPLQKHLPVVQAHSH